MRAELIAVGTELLLFGRSDSNGDWIAPRLADRGIQLTRRTLVGDDVDDIAACIKEASARSHLVLVTGGLGPTGDDLTREALARCLGRPLRVDARLLEQIANRLAARGYKSAREAAERQARVPRGCEILPNLRGSAPGLLAPGPPCWIAALPGVPGEMRPMLEGLLARVVSTSPLEGFPRGRLLIAGLPESEVDQALREALGGVEGVTATILAMAQDVEIQLLGTGEDRGRAREGIAHIMEMLRRRLRSNVCAEGDGSIALTVGRMLHARRATLAVAESCTAGLLGSAITAVPGASSWFLGGFITYSDGLKIALAGVEEDLLRRHGAVSEPVARAMAEGVRARTGASHGVSVTGIAGPEGGSPEKPVGLVHIAVAGPDRTAALRFHLGGDRESIRARSVGLALDAVRRELLEEAPRG